MQNYSYFAFLFEKGSKKFIKCRLRQNLNFVYLQKTKILILHLVAIKTTFTQQPNLRISWMIYKHSLNIQCLTVADKMKLFVLPWLPNPPSNQKDSFLRSRGICIPNLSFLCLKMAEIETFILLPWQLIYPQQPYTEIAFQVHCYLYTKSGPSTLSDSWDIEISLCCHGDLFPIAREIWRYEGKLSSNMMWIL